MQNAAFYRERAAQARHLARAQTSREEEALLERVARDYDEIAEDIENGASAIRHPDLHSPERKPNPG